MADVSYLCCCARRQGMEPHVTIVWFVLPQWFQELGAFLHEENIDIAVEWARTAFKLFGELLVACGASPFAWLRIVSGLSVSC